MERESLGFTLTELLPEHVGCDDRPFFGRSDVVTIHLHELVDELAPVLATHFNHRCLKAIVLHLKIASVCG